MDEKPTLDNLSVEELQQALYRKKRAQRQRRWQRLKDAGRVVDVAGLDLPQDGVGETAVSVPPTAATSTVDSPEPEPVAEQPKKRVQWRWISNKLLLLVEIGAVVGLVLVLTGLWGTQRELNQELAQAQRAEAAGLALPTPTATPVIDVVVLPSGHKPPVDGRVPEPGEAGNIPAHLLPAINAYQAPPAPTPGPQQARRLQIPALGVDSPIVQGDDWEQLKKGIGQHIGTGLPGQEGNIVLSAHNDIYGEIFRDLDQMEIGDQFELSTDLQTFIYVVTDIQIVDPTDVWVMQPTDHASATLISCYPYRINTHRIVIFADLVTDPGSTG